MYTNNPEIGITIEVHKTTPRSNDQRAKGLLLQQQQHPSVHFSIN